MEKHFVEAKYIEVDTITEFLSIRGVRSDGVKRLAARVRSNGYSRVIFTLY